jgi:hypothetical protein
MKKTIKPLTSSLINSDAPNLKWTMVVALALATTLLAGCISPRVTKPPQTATELRGFQRTKLVVTDAVNTAYSREGTPIFEGLLKGRLQALGCTIVETNPAVVLSVRIREFDEGDRALRTLVGFGAGRAVLKFTADFLQPSGELLAKLEGGKMYHGLELTDNPTLKSDESTRMGLISYSVSQIAKFIEENGRYR